MIVSLPSKIQDHISHGKGLCLSEAEEELRVKSEALPRYNEALNFLEWCNGLMSVTYTMLRLFQSEYAVWTQILCVDTH